MSNTYTKINGVWCVRVDGLRQPGEVVTVTTRKGRTRDVTLGAPVAPFVHTIANDLANAGVKLIAMDDEENGAQAPASTPSVQGNLLGDTEPLLAHPQPEKALGRAAKAQRAIDLLNELMEAKGATDESEVRRIVREEVSKSARLTRIEVKNRSAKLASLEGQFHPNFPLLCKMATAFGIDGYVPGIFIAGEASSGKTYACKMLAQALSLPWHFNGAISMPHEMLGFIDGGGRYHRTPFREAYEHGGVYTFDEVDRSDPNALLAVNPHLANGVAEFPDGQIKRHPDCVIICTANTWGQGADAQYVGATKLDAAFLSRFPMRLAWNIDLDFERSIVGNDRWCARVQAARARAKEAGLKVMIDVRINQAGAALIEAGLTDDEAAAQTYLANLKPEQVALIEGRPQ